MRFDDLRDEDEIWLEELERRLSAQKHRNHKDHDEHDSAECAIGGCCVVATRGLYVTLSGETRFKRYCDEHADDQGQAERLYKLGL